MSKRDLKQRLDELFTSPDEPAPAREAGTPRATPAEREVPLQGVAELTRANATLQAEIAELKRAQAELPASERKVRDVTESRPAEAELQRRNEELASLYRISQRLNRLADSSEIIEWVYDAVGQMLDNRSCYLALYDEANQSITFPIFTFDGERRSVEGRPMGNGLTEYVIRTKAPLWLPRDVIEGLQQLGIEVIGRPAYSLLSVPLLVGERAIGVITVQDYQNADTYTAAHVDWLVTIAAQAAVALENARQSAVVRHELAERERAEAELAKQQILLRTLIDNFPDQLYVKDEDSRFTLNNVAHLKLLGASRQEDVLGKSDADFFPPELAARFRADELALMQSNQALIGHEEPVGGGRWNSTTKGPLRDSQGRVVGLVGISRDITERKQVEEDLRKFKLGIERSTDVVFITDIQETIIYANPAFEKVYGYRVEEALGKTPRILKSGVMPVEDNKEFWADLLNGQAVVGEILNKTKDGRLIPIEGSYNPILDEAGNIIGFLAVHRDITERKQAEEALTRRAVQLQTAAEVSRAASSILSVDELLASTVHLIRERFDLYYAGLFLVDETRQSAVLRAGTGEAGRQMIERGHKLAVGGASMIGWCVANKQARIALDVGQDATRFDNPLLPETRSELALPLISRGEVLGAMTVQSAQEAAFSEIDIAVLQTMTEQVANAIANARLFEQTQAALAESRRLVRREDLINRISGKIRGAVNVDDVLRIAVDELRQATRSTHAVARLDAPGHTQGNGQHDNGQGVADD